MLDLRMAFFSTRFCLQWLERVLPMPGAGNQAQAAGGHEGMACAATPPRCIPGTAIGVAARASIDRGRVRDEL